MMANRIRKLVILAFMAIFLSATVCTIFGGSPLDFFPYQKGHVMIYDKIENEKKSSIRWVYRGIELVDGKEALAMDTFSKGKKVTRYYSVNNDGLYTIGYRTSNGPIRLYDKPEHYLKFPTRVGQKWTTSTPSSRYTTYEIISVNDSVLTLSEHYINCVVVKAHTDDKRFKKIIQVGIVQ